MYQIIFNRAHNMFRIIDTLRNKFVSKHKQKLFTEEDAKVFIEELGKKRQRLLALKRSEVRRKKLTVVKVK